MWITGLMLRNRRTIPHSWSIGARKGNSDSNGASGFERYGTVHRRCGLFGWTGNLLLERRWPALQTDH